MIRCKRTVVGVSFHWEVGDIADGFHEFEHHEGRWRHRVHGDEWSEWQPVELEAGARAYAGAVIPVPINALHDAEPLPGNVFRINR